MYVKITNGSVDTWPYTIGQLRRDNSNISFPKLIPSDFLASYGILPVTQQDTPSYTERTQKIELDSTPTLVDGVWTLGWTVSDKTSDEVTEYDTVTAVTNRARRDIKLTETDFYALSDVTMSSEMTAYRQALRDLPSHSNWPDLEDSDWPTKP